MAKFKLENIQIKTVEAGKQNAGNQYIVADATNVNCYWEQSQRFTSFLPNIVNILKPLLPIASGGTAAEAKPIPESLESSSSVDSRPIIPQPTFTNVTLATTLKAVGNQVIM